MEELVSYPRRSRRRIAACFWPSSCICPSAYHLAAMQWTCENVCVSSPFSAHPLNFSKTWDGVLRSWSFLSIWLGILFIACLSSCRFTGACSVCFWFSFGFLFFFFFFFTSIALLASPFRVSHSRTGVLLGCWDRNLVSVVSCGVSDYGLRHQAAPFSLAKEEVILSGLDVTRLAVSTVPLPYASRGTTRGCLSTGDEGILGWLVFLREQRYGSVGLEQEAPAGERCLASRRAADQ